MARQKRSSAILQKAEKRQAGMQAIDPTLDLGNHLTLKTYVTLIETLRAQVAIYNSTLSTLDGQCLQIKDTELQLRRLSEQMLLGVAAKYGKDSREYGQAGGVPTSERRRPTQKKKISSKALHPLGMPSTNEKVSEAVTGNGSGKTLVS